MSKQTVAVFDFDGTLTRCDTLITFIRFVYGDWRLLLGLLQNMPFIVAYKLHFYPNWKAKQRLFKTFFEGMPLKKFDECCDEFFRQWKTSLLRTDAVCCVEEYIKRGCETAIVSASIDNWILPFARSLGIKYVLGTQIELTAEGRLSGRFATPNCYGKEKVRRLQIIFPDRNKYYLVAYGDSVGDYELFEFADKSYYKLFRN